MRWWARSGTANAAPVLVGMTPELRTDVPSKPHGGAVGPVLQVKLVGLLVLGGMTGGAVAPSSESAVRVGSAART